MVLNYPPLLAGFFLAIWSLYFLLSPFLLLPSGMPQPADMLLALGIAVFAAVHFMTGRMKADTAMVAGGLFVILAFLVNTVNYAALPDTRYLQHAIIYGFNFMAFALTAALFARAPQKMARLIIVFLLILTGIEIVYTLAVNTVQNARTLGTFNSPNQFAYWGMLAFMTLVALRVHDRFRLRDGLLALGLLYLQTLALSKAAMLVCAALAVAVCFLPAMPRAGRVAAAGLALLCVVFVALMPGRLDAFLEKAGNLSAVVDRIESIGDDPADTLAARGYDRIWEHPEFLLVGSGEGGFAEKFGIHKETHSGLVTFLVSYGVLGLALFLAFLACVFNRMPWIYWFMLAGILFYGTTHQNFRDTSFWIFIGIVYAQNRLLHAPQPR